jgi:hypothetical protein
LLRRCFGIDAQSARELGARRLSIEDSVFAAPEGRVEGLAEAILQVLDARGLEVPEELRQQVLGCSDWGKLGQWLAQAATAESASVLLEPEEAARR